MAKEIFNAIFPDGQQFAFEHDTTERWQNKVQALVSKHCPATHRMNPQKIKVIVKKLGVGEGKILQLDWSSDSFNLPIIPMTALEFAQEAEETLHDVPIEFRSWLSNMANEKGVSYENQLEHLEDLVNDFLPLVDKYKRRFQSKI